MPLVDCGKKKDGSKGDSGLGCEEPDLVSHVEDEVDHNLSSADDDSRSDEDLQQIVRLSFHLFKHDEGLYKEVHRNILYDEKLRSNEKSRCASSKLYYIASKQPGQTETSAFQRLPSDRAPLSATFSVKTETKRESSPTLHPQPSLPSENQRSPSRCPLEIQPTMEPSALIEDTSEPFRSLFSPEKTQCLLQSSSAKGP